MQNSIVSVMCRLCILLSTYWRPISHSMNQSSNFTQPDLFSNILDWFYKKPKKISLFTFFPYDKMVQQKNSMFQSMCVWCNFSEALDLVNTGYSVYCMWYVSLPGYWQEKSFPSLVLYKPICAFSSFIPLTPICQFSCIFSVLTWSTWSFISCMKRLYKRLTCLALSYNE